MPSKLPHLLFAFGLLVSSALVNVNASVVAIYSFDGQNGNDASGNSNNSTGTGAYVTTTPFDTSGNYAYSVSGTSKLTANHTASAGSNVGFSDINNNLTVSFWINAGTTAAGTNDWFRIVRKGAGSTANNNWMINRNSNTSDVNIRVDSGAVNGSGYNQNLAQNASTVLNNAWHLMTYTLSYSSGTTGTYIEYLDGVAVSNGTFFFGNGLGNTHALEIGISGGSWTGLLDDVGIWSNALTTGEARSLYTLAKGGPFTYDLEVVTQLHSLHTAGTGSLTFDGFTWSYSNALSGTGRNPGDLYYNSASNQWVLQMTATSGLVAVPEPARAALLVLAAAFVLTRRSRRVGSA